MNTRARRPRTAHQIRHDLAQLATARAINIDEVDISDIDLARVRRTRRIVDLEIALVKHNRMVRILDMDVLVGDIIDEAVADIRASPGLEAGAVLAVEQRDVLDPRVGDVVFYAGVLADGAHGDAVRAVAPQVLDEDVGRVGLGAEAVVADVDACVGYG